MNLIDPPSAIQFRMRGCKGVFCTWKTNSFLELRRSQEKFKCKYKMLEVVKTSTYKEFYLNRQMISLLSDLGVPDKVLKKLPSYLPAEVLGDGEGRGEEAREPALNGGFSKKLTEGRREAPSSALIVSILSISSSSSWSPSSARCLSSDTGEPRLSVAWNVPRLPY